MGTFEKLGILVIVVIIVMILAVAIYQWGGNAAEPVSATGGMPEPLTVRIIDEIGGEPAPLPVPDPKQATWPGGIPKRYVVVKNDKTWVLVVRRWRLKDSFIGVLAKANPRIDVDRLKPGQALVVPDPAGYVKGTKKAATPTQKKGLRTYEVQIGDTLETIAHKHLGSRARWKEILQHNPGLNPKRMRDGDVIYVPVR